MSGKQVGPGLTGNISPLPPANFEKYFTRLTPVYDFGNPAGFVEREVKAGRDLVLLPTAALDKLLASHREIVLNYHELLRSGTNDPSRFDSSSWKIEVKNDRARVSGTLVLDKRSDIPEDILLISGELHVASSSIDGAPLLVIAEPSSTSWEGFQGKKTSKASGQRSEVNFSGPGVSVKCPVEARGKFNISIAFDLKVTADPESGYFHFFPPESRVSTVEVVFKNPGVHPDIIGGVTNGPVTSSAGLVSISASVPGGARISVSYSKLREYVQIEDEYLESQRKFEALTLAGKAAGGTPSDTPGIPGTAESHGAAMPAGDGAIPDSDAGKPVEIRREPEIFCWFHLIHDMTNKEITTYGIAKIRVDVKPVTSLQISVGPSDEMVQVECPDLESSPEITGSGPDRTLCLTFVSPLMGERIVGFKIRRPVHEGSTLLTPPAPSLKGARTEVGFMGVCASENVKLTEAQTSGLERIDPNELDPALTGRSPAPVFFAYKYVRHPYELAMESVAYPDYSEDLLPAFVTSCEAVTKLNERGSAITEMTALLANAAMQHLEIDLDSGTELIEAAVDGKAVSPIMKSGSTKGTMMIPLIRSQKEDDRAVYTPFRVSLRYRHPFGPDAAVADPAAVEPPEKGSVKKTVPISAANGTPGSIDIDLPLPNVVVKTLKWSVICPGKFSFFAPASDAFLINRPTGLLAFGARVAARFIYLFGRSLFREPGGFLFIVILSWLSWTSWANRKSMFYKGLFLISALLLALMLVLLLGSAADHALATGWQPGNGMAEIEPGFGDFKTLSLERNLVLKGDRIWLRSVLLNRWEILGIGFACFLLGAAGGAFLLKALAERGSLVGMFVITLVLLTGFMVSPLHPIAETGLVSGAASTIGVLSILGIISGLKRIRGGMAAVSILVALSVPWGLPIAFAGASDSNLLWESLPAKNLEVKVPVRNGEESGKPLPAGGASALLQVEDYEVLTWMATDPDEAVKVAVGRNRPGTDPVAVAAGLSMSGKVFEDHAELDIEVMVLKRGLGPAALTLFGPGIVPVSSSNMPESVEMGSNGLNAIIHEKGIHRLKLTAAVPVGKDLASGKRWLDLNLPVVPGATLVLEIPGKTVKVTAEPAIDTLSAFTREGTRTTFRLMGAAFVSVTWYDRGAQISAPPKGAAEDSGDDSKKPEPVKAEVRTPRLYSRVDSLSTIAEGFVRTGFSPGVTITYAPEETLNFKLPKGFIVHKIDGAQVKGFRILSREDGRDGSTDKTEILAVDLISPIQGTVRFTVQGETTLPADAGKAVIPMLSLEGAVQESGTVSIATDSSLEISFEAGENIRPVDIGEGRAAVQAGGLKTNDTTIILSYRYPSFPATLTMAVRKFPKVGLLPVAADGTFISAFVDSKGRTMMNAQFTVRNNGSQFMAVNVPPGAKILSASVGDRTVVPARGPDGTALLPMKRSVMASGGFSSFPAGMVFLCPPGRESGISTLLPTPSVFTGQTGLAFQTERQFSVLRTRTSMAEGQASPEKLVKAAFKVNTGFEDLGQTLGASGAAMAARLFDETFRSRMSLVNAEVPKIPGPELEFNKRIELPREGATIPFQATLIPSRVTDGIGLVVFYYGIVLSFLCLTLVRNRRLARLVLFALFIGAAMAYLSEFFQGVGYKLLDGMALGIFLAAARSLYLLDMGGESRIAARITAPLIALALVLSTMTCPAAAFDADPGFCLPVPDLTLARGFEVSTAFADLEASLVNPGKTGFLTSPERFMERLRTITLKGDGLRRVNPSFLDPGASVTATSVRGGMLGETFVAEVTVELSKPAWGWTAVQIARHDAPPFLLSSEGEDVLAAPPALVHGMSAALGIKPLSGLHTLFIRDPGPRRITYSVASALKKGDTTIFGYWVPKGAINRFQISLPRGADPKTSGIILSKNLTPRGLVIEGVCGGGLMEVTWAEASGSAAEAKTAPKEDEEVLPGPVQSVMTPEVRSEATTLFTVDEAVVTGYTSFNLRITGSPVREVAFSLADARIVEILGTEVSCWESSSAGICRVMFNRGVLGLADLSVKYEKDLPRGDFETFAPVPQITGARRDSGFIAVEASPTLNLSVIPEGGLETLPIQSIPSFLHENTRRPFVAAFKYFSLPAGLKLSGARTPAVEGSLVTAICDEMSIQAATSDNGEVVISATMQVRNKTRQFIEVSLPQGCGILNCVSAGRLAKPLERDPGSGKILLPIPPSETASDGSATQTTVAFTYSGSMDVTRRINASPGNQAMETASLPTPSVDLPVSRVKAEIFMPESKRIVGVSGDLKPQFPGRGFLPEKIGDAFFRDACAFLSVLTGMTVNTGWEGLGLVAVGVFLCSGVLGLGRTILKKLKASTGGTGNLLGTMNSTLTGIAVIVLIVAFLFALATPQFSSMSEDSKTSKVKQDLDVYVNSIIRYKAMESRPFNGIGDLVGKYIAREMYDPWGNDYVVDIVNGRCFSRGPDGMAGTGDDISMSYMPPSLEREEMRFSNNVGAMMPEAPMPQSIPRRSANAFEDELSVSMEDAGPEQDWDVDSKDSARGTLMEKKSKARSSAPGKARPRTRPSTRVSKGGSAGAPGEAEPFEGGFLRSDMAPPMQTQQAAQVQDFMKLVQSRPVKKGVSGVLPVDPSIPASSLRVEATGDSIATGRAPVISIAMVEGWVDDSMKWGAVLLGALCAFSLTALFGRTFDFGRAVLIILCGGAMAGVAVYLPWLQSSVDQSATMTLFAIFVINLLSVPSIYRNSRKEAPEGPDGPKGPEPARTGGPNPQDRESRETTAPADAAGTAATDQDPATKPAESAKPIEPADAREENPVSPKPVIPAIVVAAAGLLALALAACVQPASAAETARYAGAATVVKTSDPEAWADEGTSSVSRRNEILINRLVPTSGSSPAEAILVSPEAAMTVRDLAGLSRAVQPSVTTTAGSLTSMEISGSAGLKIATLDLVVSFSKIGEGPYSIPLARNRPAVTGFESSGAESRLGDDGRSLCLEVLGEGSGSARISFSVPVKTSGRIKTMDPELITGMSIPFRIKRPEANLTVIPENGHCLPAEDDMCLGIISGPSTLLRVETPSKSGQDSIDGTSSRGGSTPEDKPGPASPDKTSFDNLKRPKVTTTIFEKFTVFDLYVSGTVTFENSITMAPLGNYEIAVPHGWDVLEANGSDVSGWSVISEGELRTLVIHLRKAHIDKKAITLEMERIFHGQPEKIAFPAMIPSASSAFTSFTGIINNTGSMMSPDLEAITNSSGVSPDTLPKKSFGYDSSIYSFAFTSSSLDRSVSLRIEKPGTIKESQATCISSSASSFFDEAGVVTTRVTYNLMNLATQHLEITLPDGSVLMSASVGGKTVTPASLAPGKISLPLVKSASLNSGVATVPVEITFVLEKGRTGGMFDLDLTLPSIAIETGQTSWSISTDLEAVMTNSSGDLTLVNESFPNRNYTASRRMAETGGPYGDYSGSRGTYGKSFVRKQHLSKEIESLVSSNSANFQKVYTEGKSGNVTPLEVRERTGKNLFTFTTSSSSPGQCLSLTTSFILGDGVTISAAFLFILSLSAMALIIWGGYRRSLTSAGVGVIVFLALLGFSKFAPGLSNYIFSGAGFASLAALTGYGVTLPRRAARAIKEV